MKKRVLTFGCLLLVTMFASCSEKEDEAAPCLNARVVDVEDPCSGGVVLELTKEEFSSENDGFCGTPNLYKYVTVDNLPEHLKQEGATFTCQVKETASAKACIAIYPVYQTASITQICSQPITSPIVTAKN